MWGEQNNFEITKVSDFWKLSSERDRVDEPENPDCVWKGDAGFGEEFEELCGVLVEKVKEECEGSAVPLTELLLAKVYLAGISEDRRRYSSGVEGGDRRRLEEAPRRIA